MPRFVLIEPFWNGERLCRAGETIDWDGPSAPYMQPVDDESDDAAGTEADRGGRKGGGGGRKAAPSPSEE